MNEVAQSLSSAMRGPQPLCVEAVFETGNGKGYHYFVQPGDNPQPGDMIVTSYKSIGTRHTHLPDSEDIEENGFPFLRLSQAIIVRVFSSLQPLANKAYLFLLPAEELKLRAKQNTEISAKLRARQAALDELERRFQAAQRLALYKSMADSDPQAAELLRAASWTPGE